MRTAKCHPVANWLRVDGATYSRSLDRVLADRDQQMLSEPGCSGLPPASRSWFWTEQLATLITNPAIREQVLRRLAELSARRIAIDAELQNAVGGLVAEQSEIDVEVQLLEQVLQ